MATAALLGSGPLDSPQTTEPSPKLLELVRMGFPEKAAREALTKNFDNIEHAVLQLLGSSGEHAEMEPAAEIISPLSPTLPNDDQLADRRARYAAAEERLSNDLLSEDTLEPSAPPLSTTGRRQEAGFTLDAVPRPPVELPATCWACDTPLTFDATSLYTICCECGTLTTIYGQNGEALCETLRIT